MKEKTRGPLTPYETAAIASGVPASGDAAIDAILTQALRFKTAASILEGAVAKHGLPGTDEGQTGYVIDAIRLADLLITQFRAKRDERK